MKKRPSRKGKRTYHMGKERIAKCEEMHYIRRAQECLDEAKGILDLYFADQGPALELWSDFKKKLDTAKRLYKKADLFRVKAEHHITKQMGVSE
jgi:hypothetical protein